jgi:hypothetical protein
MGPPRAPTGTLVAWNWTSAGRESERHSAAFSEMRRPFSCCWIDEKPEIPAGEGEVGSRGGVKMAA